MVRAAGRPAAAGFDVPRFAWPIDAHGGDKWKQQMARRNAAGVATTSTKGTEQALLLATARSAFREQARTGSKRFATTGVTPAKLCNVRLQRRGRQQPPR